MERWERWESLKAHREAEVIASNRPAIVTSLLTPVIRGDGALVESRTLLEEESSSGMEMDSEEDENGDPIHRSKTEGDAINVNVVNLVSFADGGPKNIKGKMSRLKLRALDFLSNIVLESEREEAGIMVGERNVTHELTAGNTLAKSEEPVKRPAPNDPQTQPELVYEGGGGGMYPEEIPTGIRLRGSSQVSYVCKRMGNGGAGQLNQRVQGAHLKSSSSKATFEQNLLNSNIHDSSRIFLSWEKGYPAMVFSVIKYNESADSKRRKKSKLSSVIMEMPRRRHEVPKILSDVTWLQKRYGTSYARYFNKQWAEASGDKVDPSRIDEDESWDYEYRPEYLDDPRIRQGKHRTVQSLDGYYLSIIPYTKTKDLKAELNEVFREQHPDLPPDLTLSKIRNLKREVLEHVKHVDLELSTAALAIVYFEKLVFKGVVKKVNRKLVMSVCLVLAFKFNEPYKPGMEKLNDLLEDIERVQSLTPKQVLEAEFPVFGHLLFHLNIDKDQILAHFSRLLKQTELTPTEYLGEELAQFYFPEEKTVSIVSPISSPIADKRHHQKHKRHHQPNQSQQRHHRKKKSRKHRHHKKEKKPKASTATTEAAG